MKTIGETRIRTEFNPSKTELVDLIKQKSAELIDLVNSMPDKDERLKSIAMTAIEEASMWAVKAATS